LCNITVRIHVSQLAFAMYRFANFLHVLLLLLCLALAWYCKDPHLFAVRDFGLPILIAAALIGLIVTFRSMRTRTRQAFFFLAAWLAIIGMAGYKEYEFREQKQAVLAATENTQRLTALGKHLVVGYEKVNDIRELVERRFIAGIFVTRRNAEGKSFDELRAELAHLQMLRNRANLPPLIIASDQEGGLISRLSPPLSRQPALATLLSPGLSDAEISERATRYGAEQGKALAALGVNMNFSPVVDLKPTQPSGVLDLHTRIAGRAIAAEPEIVAKAALAYSRGLLAQGILPTLKHFPGLGSVTEDTHHFSARLKRPLNELMTRDWYPFRRILSQSTALMMVGHVIVDAIDAEFPASLSRRLITGIVRENWRHNGVLISDDMTMAAVYNRGLCRSSILSLNAGVDLLLVSYDWEKVYPVLDCLLKTDKSGQLNDLNASDARVSALVLRK